MYEAKHVGVSLKTNLIVTNRHGSTDRRVIVMGQRQCYHSSIQYRIGISRDDCAPQLTFLCIVLRIILFSALLPNSIAQIIPIVLFDAHTAVCTPFAGCF